MKKLFLTGILFATLLPSFASHIVGAELSYSCNGGNNYHITLKLYRDCFCTNCAPFGNPEYLAIFNASGTLISQPSMPFPGSNQLNPTISSPCLTPPQVCIEEADYTADVNLPASAGGYTIVYQRCCRNTGVVNLAQIGGNSQGATYTIHIPDPSLATCNSSPVFNSLPPIFICVNAPISVDYSATDPDGDVLIYSLCDPYDGADGNCPDPSPAAAGSGCPTAPNAPPFTSVLYNAPYSASNFTNNPSSNGNFTIDPSTGLLTGTPNGQGIYDVTVCVSEYRNGQLLGITRRDFQFNIVQCNTPIASVPNVSINHGIGVYQINCKSSTVNFVSTTYNPSSNPLTYHWDFGVGSATNDTANIANPTFTYPDTGLYLVHLIVSEQGPGGQPCTDTTEALVYSYPTFETDFSANNVCSDSFAQFFDGTISTSGTLSSWNWDFGDGSNSTVQNPTHLYASGGTYSVTLIDANSAGCKDTMQKSITIYTAPIASFTAGASCVNTPITFNNTSTGATSFAWDFGTIGASSTQQNPTYTYTTPGSFTVSLVEASAAGCTDTSIQIISVHAIPTVDISDDTLICPYTSMQLNAHGGVTYVWIPGSGLNNANIANPLATPLPPSKITYTVVVTDQFQCTNSDSVTISFYPITNIIDAGPDTSVCFYPGSRRDSVQLQATSGWVSYNWTPKAGLSNSHIADPVCRPPVTTMYFVTGTDANHCKLTDSVLVSLHNTSLVNAGNDTTIFRDTYAQLHGTTPLTNYFWNPSSWLDDAFALNTSASPPQTTWYELFAIDQYGCINKDSILITVISNTVLNIPSAFSPNGDGVNDVFRIVGPLNIARLKTFAIYNRWGEKIFTTENINQGWDGTFQGKQQPIGVYIWMLDAESIDGEDISRKGNVTLVR